MSEQATDDLPAGQIRFLDAWLPTLGAGSYRVTASHHVQDGSAVDELFPQTRSFVVTGPRFALQDADVHALMPPANQTGEFNGTLPYIVLAKRSLPWERTIDGTMSDAVHGVPWMALLVFEEDEIVKPDDGTSYTATGCAVRSLTEIVTPPTGILGPSITPAANDPPRCLAVDVKATAFQAVVPQLGELSMLAHVRQVDTGGKEILGVDDDGWFSVVIANRWPAPAPAGSTQPLKTFVHLVSLEGYKDNLPLSDTFDPSRVKNNATVRLVSLASWTFSCLPDVGDFASIVEALDVGLPALPHQKPDAWGAKPTQAELLVLGGLAAGYSPVNYTTRLGEQTVAWYRGPLLPEQTADASLDPFFSAESGMIYDETTGMFDLSYSVAWQLGRLLALSDQGYAKAVLNWRQAGEGGVNLLHERLALAARFGTIVGSAKDQLALMAPGMGNDVAKRFLASVLAPRTVPANSNAVPLIQRTDPSGLLDQLSRVPGVMAPAALNAVLDAGRDPAAALRGATFTPTDK